MLFPAACADKTDSSTIKSQAFEASAIFRINWHTELDPMARDVSADALDCAIEGVVTVRGEVYDGDGVRLASGGPWSCGDHAGRITGIPPGTARRFTILGEDESGITWQGQSAPVDLRPGDGNDAGTIDAYPFRPQPNEPPNGARAPLGPVSLTWSSVTNAADYHVLVGTEAGFDSQSVVVDTVSTAPEYTLAGYIPGSSYYWRISARDAFGNESAAIDPLYLFHTAMEMPNLIDMAREDAQNTIESLQLVTGSMNPVCSDTLPNGSIIRHQPAFGSAVYRGDPVRFTVSNGLCNVDFPDAALETSIRATVAIPEGPIPEAALRPLTELSVSYLGIGNIEGLQYLTSLQNLDLRSNQIRDIDVLSGLTNLRSLYLFNNQIQNIEALSGLTNLGSLYLFNNQIQSIDALSGLTAMETLSLSDNQIQNIDALSGLTNLSNLVLYNNQIRSIDALAGLTRLSNLDLSSNQIQIIDALALLTELRDLNLGSNSIQNIDVLAALTDLQVLRIGYNRILNISALAGLTHLQTLWLTSNQIQSIDALVGLTNVQDLSLNLNQIQVIDALSGMTQLSRLDLSLNQIQSIEPLVNNPGIGQDDAIDLRDNPLDAVSCGEDIPQLISRGTSVSHSCQ